MSRPTSTVGDYVEYVEHFQHRVIQDALNEACAGYWIHRAEQFEAVGNPACDETAKACRSRARVSLLGGEEW